MVLFSNNSYEICCTQYLVNYVRPVEHCLRYACRQCFCVKMFHFIYYFLLLFVYYIYIYIYAGHMDYVGVVAAWKGNQPIVVSGSSDGTIKGMLCALFGLIHIVRTLFIQLRCVNVCYVTCPCNLLT